VPHFLPCRAAATTEFVHAYLLAAPAFYRLAHRRRRRRVGVYVLWQGSEVVFIGRAIASLPRYNASA
jgi:hypothetical protein